MKNSNGLVEEENWAVEEEMGKLAEENDVELAVAVENWAAVVVNGCSRVEWVVVAVVKEKPEVEMVAEVWVKGEVEIVAAEIVEGEEVVVMEKGEGVMKKGEGVMVAEVMTVGVEE